MGTSFYTKFVAAQLTLNLDDSSNLLTDIIGTKLSSPRWKASDWTGQRKTGR
ncbi:hypothetical protein IH992_31650 [Candidatus Poribacteria bacterium]|nr:hypothetical protein [Candidatus Poribacteria bacterium]